MRLPGFLSLCGLVANKAKEIYSTEEERNKVRERERKKESERRATRKKSEEGSSRSDVK